MVRHKTPSFHGQDISLLNVVSAHFLVIKTDDAYSRQSRMEGGTRVSPARHYEVNVKNMEMQGKLPHYSR